MASLFRVTLPERLQSALELRSSASASDCPEDVQVAMSKLSFFCSPAPASLPAPPSSRFAGRLGGSESSKSSASSSSGGETTGTSRFGHLNHSSTWRPTHSSAPDEEGFQTYTRRRGGASGGSGGSSRPAHGGGAGGGRHPGSGGSAKTGSWGGGGHGRYWNQGQSHGHGHNHGHSYTSKQSSASAPGAAAAAPTPSSGAVGGAGAVTTPMSEGSTTPPVLVPAPTTEPAPIAFSSAAVKANIATEERILAKVKGKINKLGPSTYEVTKIFMQQILDSDETDFLDDFMKFVFQKAATEAAFCPIYARLLHELADEFTHLRDVMRTLFRDYMNIFTEVEHTSPDPSSETYKEFLESQERKKFRRGYSQFVAELVKHGEVDVEGFRTLIFQITSAIESFHTDSSKTQLSEEYIDCLSNMCKSASPILIANAWSADLVARLAALIAKPAAALPGFTAKSRFALMNLTDYARRGWK